MSRLLLVKGCEIDCRLAVAPCNEFLSCPLCCLLCPGQMQFMSKPGQHAAMSSPLYWWHQNRPAQCLVQFQSEAVDTQVQEPVRNLPLGLLSVSVHGLEKVLWRSSFTNLALRSKHKQQFFFMTTSGPFKLLLNASSLQPGVAITVEGISVHCCPGKTSGTRFQKSCGLVFARVNFILGI